MLILGADELQIRPNGESALKMLILSAGELQIRPNEGPLTEGWQSTESHESKEQVLAKSRKRLNEPRSAI